MSHLAQDLLAPAVVGFDVLVSCPRMQRFFACIQELHDVLTGFISCIQLMKNCIHDAYMYTRFFSCIHEVHDVHTDVFMYTAYVKLYTRRILRIHAWSNLQAGVLGFHRSEMCNLTWHELQPTFHNVEDCQERGKNRYDGPNVCEKVRRCPRACHRSLVPLGGA